MLGLHDDEVMKIISRRLDTNNNDLLLDKTQEGKLSCTCKSVKNVFSQIKSNRQFWMTEGQEKFKDLFSSISEVCRMAGYRQSSIPGFDDCIKNYLILQDSKSGTSYIRSIQQKMQLETPKNGEGISIDKTRIIISQMQDFKIGREEGCENIRDFKCDRDPCVSRQQAIMHKEEGCLMYRNISTTSDSWYVNQTTSSFEKISKKTPEVSAHQVTLRLGDCVIISTSNLSVLRIIMGESDEIDILNEMHDLRNHYKVTEGPSTVEEAHATLTLARAQRNKDIFDNFNHFWRIKVHALGLKSITFYNAALLRHSIQTTEKITKMNSEIKQYEEELTDIKQLNYYREKLENVYVCTSENEKKWIIQRFVKVLQDPGIKNKDQVEWHFFLYRDFMKWIEAINEGDHSRADPRLAEYMTVEEAGFEDEAGCMSQLSRREIQNGFQLHNQWCPLDTDEDDVMVKKFSAEEMHVWLVEEEKEYSDYVSWREAIIREYGLPVSRY